MKLLFDFLPIVLFFAAYKAADIYVATGVAIAATTIQVAFVWFRHRKFEKMHLITLALIIVLGGATLLLHDEIFIKWKPSVINWLFAIVFLGSQFVGKKTIIQRMMEANVTLPSKLWQRLNLAWVVFFTGVGILNLYVVYQFDTDTWVNFKLFGILGLTLVFVLGQAVYLTKFLHSDDQATEK